MPQPALPDLLSLRGKRALITGAASGIGKAIALRFAEAGAGLELVDRDEEGLRRLRETLREGRVEVHIHRVDLSRKEEIEALWARLKGRSVEILMNNAGVYTFRPFEEIDEAFYDGAMAVNLDAVFWMCQAFIFKTRLPMSRFGDPDEVARAALFLASDLASYINGAVLAVDGGFLSS